MSSIDWDALKVAAKEAQKNAYAPYSGFKVGAAVSSGGNIFSGCNVENASFPVGLCAERAAIAAAVSSGFQELDALVVYADKPVVPCGMCRQALAEFNPKLPILMVSNNLESGATLPQLFPEPFDLKR